MKCAISPGSYDNSMVRSYNDSNQYSNEECSTCCRSSSSTLTKDYSEMTKCGNEMDDVAMMQDMSMEECPSCKTNNSRSSSHHNARKEWGDMSPEDYDYPQWQWLRKENSFRQVQETKALDTRRSTAGRSDQNRMINLCDILPPPPYERSVSKAVNFES